jgi:hypothetical protein
LALAGLDDVTLERSKTMSMRTIIVAAAILAMLGGPSRAATYGHAHSKAHAHQHAQGMATHSSAYGAGFDSSARAAFGRSYDFEGWPTDYLENRFGDRQMQGR